MAGRESPLERLPGDRTTQAVLLVALLGLGARLVFLGARIAHQDEARVAYWTLRYLESGVFEYRPIVHGPFLPIVTRWSFALLGPSDFAARLPVAIVGTLLPVSALLLRDRLRNSEVVVLSALLASAPILLYYSRFYRSDIPTATFAFVAFGFFVRTYDHRRPRDLLFGTAALALSFTAKENALLYPVCWLGGLALLFDHRLFVARLRDSTPFAIAKRRVWSALVGFWRWRWYLVLAVVEFLAIIVFFYAPRGGGYGPPYSQGHLDLWLSLERLVVGRPGPFLAVVDEALIGSAEALSDQWLRSPENSYLPYLEDFLLTMQAGALVVSILAVLGFVVDRYASSGPRDVVALASYWGVASVFGYPIATDIQAPWATVHAVVPLAIPAAVGIALIYRWGVDSLLEGDEIGVTAAVLVLVLLGGQIGVSAYVGVYAHPQDPNNELVQYAQSSSPDLKPALMDTIGPIARENEGVDVLFYGQDFNSNNESAADFPGPPRGGGWYDRLPIAWYFEIHEYRLERAGAVMNVSSRAAPELVTSANRSALPPVVIAFADSPEKHYDDHEGNIVSVLGDYTRYQFQRYAWSSPFVIYVKNDYDPSIEKRVPQPAWKTANESESSGNGSIFDRGLTIVPAENETTTDATNATNATTTAIDALDPAIGIDPTIGIESVIVEDPTIDVEPRIGRSGDRGRSNDRAIGVTPVTR
jgi:uncharacterized protein (TIGR03663 family)